MYPLEDSRPNPGPPADVRVVMDSDGQPCLWPTDCPLPPGWTDGPCPPLWQEAQAYLHAHLHTPPEWKWSSWPYS